MYRLATLIRSGLGLLAATALAMILAACTIASEQLLLTEAEAVTPLPESFLLTPYDESGAGFKRSDNTAMGFTLAGKTYDSAADDMTALFAPLGDDYLVAINTPNGVMYGVGAIADNVLVIDIIVDDIAGNTDLQAITGATPTEGGLMVTDRAALDAVIALHQAGKLPMNPVVMYITPDANTPTPETLTRNGNGWTAD